MIFYIGKRRFRWNPKTSKIPCILMVSEPEDKEYLEYDRVGDRAIFYKKEEDPRTVDEYAIENYREGLDE